MEQSAEAAQKPEKKVLDPWKDEFLKVYYVILIVNAVISIAQVAIYGKEMMTLQTEPTSGVVIMGAIASILGFILFVLSIVALVRFLKRKYDKKLIIVPIIYIVAPIVLSVVGIVLSITSFGKYMKSGAEFDPQTGPSPEQFQEMMPSAMNYMPYISAGVELIVLVLAVYILVSLYNEHSDKSSS